MSLLGIIFTIIASGVFAAVIAYRLNATKEHVFFMRQKAEALYLAIEEYDRSLGTYFLGYYSLLKNEITYNELLDLQIGQDNDNGRSARSLDMINMLVNVYFPQVKDHLRQFDSARVRIQEILADQKRAYKAGDTDGTAWFSPFHEANIESSNVAKAFKTAVLSEAVSLATTEQFWPQSMGLSGIRAKIVASVGKDSDST